MTSRTILKITMFATALFIELYALDYSDLEATKVACPEYDSCASRTRNQIFENRNCECDSECVTYNDCCIDSNRDSIGYKQDPSRFTCMPYDVNLSNGAYVISTCQQNWQGTNEIRSKCEVLNDLSDPLIATPATDTRRGITYRNLYCAECNRALPGNLSSWQILIRCKTLKGNPDKFTWDGLTYKANLNEWGITKNNIYHACDISFPLPAYLKNSVRECVPNVIGTCPQTWLRMEIRKMCSAYMAITRYGNDFYRNPHCALCNGLNLNQMTCEKKKLSRNNRSKRIGVLFDVNKSDGNVVGETPKGTHSCPAGQYYDPFKTKACRESSCLPGQTLKNAECVSS